MAVKKKSADAHIDVQPIKMARFKAHILGVTPMIMHRFAAKSWHELLLPSQKKNAAAKAETLKHDPLTEFRECCYRNREMKEPTLLHYPAGAFSKAIAAAALDLPGASKSQILRLVSVTNTQVNLYGVPMLGMDMVRSSDMARTPDVRTRAYLPEWTACIELEFVSSLIGETQIINLLAAAGHIVGLGDYRPQKGGSFGKFIVAQPDDPDVSRIQKQARAAQEAALRSPSFYNDDAAELYGWFTEEVERREKTPPSSLEEDGAHPKKQAKTPAAAKKLAAVAKKKTNGKALVA